MHTSLLPPLALSNVEEGRFSLLPLFYKQETIPGGVSTGQITEAEFHVTLVDLPGCLMVGDMDRPLQRPIQLRLWFVSQGREIVPKNYLSFSID